jgi:tetratricopeptide (TPR) repeat protein
MKPLPSPVLALHEISLYNTGRISPEKIKAAFAARLQQFERIVADIGAEKPGSRAQHHLIVGQRGMGKTMILARIAAELRLEPDLAERFIPLVFAEEQYSVDRLSKFWLNCLDSLADAREAANDTRAVEEIDATVAKLQTAGARAPKDDQPFADEVYAAFAAASRATGQRPVLLVDNLQLVFERLDHGQQHSLRELLMRPGSPILVGASPSPPPPTQDYGAAFYDHFKVHYLRPLDENEMRDLLLRLAEAAGRDDVRQRVLQHPGRLKALRQLTGGNPRTTLTLFFLYAEDFSPTVFGDLEGLLDRVTPLYKARFEELTPQQQVIVSAIANHWDPITAAALASATGVPLDSSHAIRTHQRHHTTANLPAGTISAQLDRLEKAGVIERTELFGETRTGYLLAERFFNIWFLMRSASRRQRREVEFLTRFLESFYEPTDRTRIARHLMGEERFSPDRYLWSRAVAASLSEPGIAEDLNRHAELAALREEARDARARLHELIDFDSLPPATLAFADLRKKLASLVPAAAEISPEDFAKRVLGDRAMFMSGEREQLAARTGKLSREEIRSVLETIQKNRTADEATSSPEAAEWLCQRLSTGQIRSHHDAADWNRAFEQADGEATIQLLVESLPDGFGNELSEATFGRISTALQPSAESPAWQWNNWGCDLSNKLCRHAQAENAYREAITRDPKSAYLLFNLGVLLQNHLQRYAEAESAYQEALARDPKDAAPWNGLGNLYCDHLDRPADAEEAFENALRFDPTKKSIRQNRIFLRRDFMGEGSAARSLLDELSALPNHEYPDTTCLHEALFSAYDSNWGLACDALSQALEIRIDGFTAYNTDDWLRASAVLLHLNYGAELLAFLDQRGDTVARLRPWVEALRALQVGDRRALQNIAPEIRTTAEVFYDRIEHLLKKLPEKTCRRPVAKLARSRGKRKSR